MALKIHLLFNRQSRRRVKLLLVEGAGLGGLTEPPEDSVYIKKLPSSPPFSYYFWPYTKR